LENSRLCSASRRRIVPGGAVLCIHGPKKAVHAASQCSHEVGIVMSDRWLYGIQAGSRALV